mgnify:FL=1
MLLEPITFAGITFVIHPASSHGGDICAACRTYMEDRISPIIADERIIEPLPLCWVCSHKSSARILAVWPSGIRDLFGLWRAVRAEQCRSAECADERANAPVVSLEELRGRVRAIAGVVA